MADIHTPRIREATYNHLIYGSSDASAKPLAEKNKPVTQVPNSQSSSDQQPARSQQPKADDSIVQDSIDQHLPSPIPQDSTLINFFAPTQPSNNSEVIPESIETQPLELDPTSKVNSLVHDKASVQASHGGPSFMPHPSFHESVTIESTHLEDDGYNATPHSQYIRTSQTRKSVVTGTDLTVPSMVSKSSTHKSATAGQTQKVAAQSVKAKPSQRASQPAPIQFANTGATSSTTLLHDLKAGKASQANVTQQLAPRSEVPLLKRPVQKASLQPVHIPTAKKPSQQRQTHLNASSSKKQRSRDAGKSDEGSEFDIPQSPRKQPSKSVSKSKPTTGTSVKRGRGRPRKTVPDEDEDEDDKEYSVSNIAKTRAAPVSRQTRASTRAQTAEITKNDGPNVSTRNTAKAISVEKAKPVKKMPTKPATPDSPPALESLEIFENNVTHLNSGGVSEVEVELHPQPAKSSTTGKTRGSLTTDKSAYLMNLISNPDYQHREPISRDTKIKHKVVEASAKPSVSDQTAVQQQGIAQPNTIVGEEDDDDDVEDHQFNVTAPSGYFDELQHQSLADEVIPPRRLVDAPLDSSDLSINPLMRERANRKPNIVGFSDEGPKNQGSIRQRKRPSGIPSLPLNDFEQNDSSPAAEGFFLQGPLAVHTGHLNPENDLDEEFEPTQADEIKRHDGPSGLPFDDPRKTPIPSPENPQRKLVVAAENPSASPNKTSASASKAQVKPVMEHSAHTVQVNQVDKDEEAHGGSKRISKSTRPQTAETTKISKTSAAVEIVTRVPSRIEETVNQPKAAVTLTSAPRVKHVRRTSPEPRIQAKSSAVNPKRPNTEPIEDGEPTKRPRLDVHEGVRRSLAKAPVLTSFGSRKLSQVTDDGSPMPQGGEVPQESTIAHRAISNNPVGDSIPPPQFVKVPSTNPFPELKIPKQREKDDTQDLALAQSQGLSKKQPIVSQAITHAGFDEDTQVSAEDLETRGPHEGLFANTQSASPIKNAAAQPSAGLLNALRAKVIQQAPEQPVDDGSEEASQAAESMEEDDPDKTLVNDVSDEDDGSESDESSDTDVEEGHQNALTVWRNALKPHQEDVHDALMRIAHRFVAQLVDHETAIEDISNDYSQDGIKLIERFEKEHEARFEGHCQKVTRMKEIFVRGFSSVSTNLQKDAREVKMSSERLYKVLQAEEDAGGRLEKIMQMYHS